MKRVLAILLLTLSMLSLSLLPAHAQFVSATVISLRNVRNAAGAVTGIAFTLVLRDDAVPSELRDCSYTVQGDEFAGLPAPGAARRSALVAIAKREAHVCFDAWVAERAARAQPPVILDPTTDMGANSFSSFTGEAAPTPTP